MNGETDAVNEAAAAARDAAMGSMVERVAREIWGEFSDPDDDGPWGTAPDVRKSRYVTAARYAIAAMRVPTWKMREAGEAAAPPNTEYDLPDDVPKVWRAMIDAALKEDHA